MLCKLIVENSYVVFSSYTPSTVVNSEFTLLLTNNILAVMTSVRQPSVKLFVFESTQK